MKTEKPKVKVEANNVLHIREGLLMSKAELARRAGLSVLTIDRVEKGMTCRMDTKRKRLTGPSGSVLGFYQPKMVGEFTRANSHPPRSSASAHRLHDGSRNWDHLNLIFPVYFDLMRQFSPISPEGAREVFLH
jgi:hypothetical protein